MQYFVYAIAMATIYFTISHLHNKDNPKKEDPAYVVKIPSAFITVFAVMFWFGIALFLVWGILYLNGFQGEGKVTAGHLIFAIAFAGAGLLLVVWGSSWRITVNENQVIVHRLLRKEIVFSIDDVNAVRQEKQTKMGPAARIIIKKDGKKIAAAEWSCENYDRFEKDLIEAGRLRGINLGKEDV